jgi:hypothetical protein
MKKVAQTHTPQTVEDEQGHYEFDIYGDWTGYAHNGRRTLLKGTLQAAQSDVRTGRFVCPCWPNCRHKGPM